MQPKLTLWGAMRRSGAHRTSFSCPSTLEFTPRGTLMLLVRVAFMESYCYGALARHAARVQAQLITTHS